MKLAVRIFAILLLAAAVAMAFLYKGGKPEADNTPPPVRPVKSMLVGPPPRVPSIHFPGVVDARAGVDLSFEVGGRIVEFPATRGLEVKEGDVLARLDDRDYANSVKTAEAELAYAESNFKRMEAALAQNAVSQDEFSSARASRDKARAALDSAKKALDDTVLKARFSGVVSDTYADNFDTVSAGTPILKLQDLTAFDLAVSVPESYVLSGSADVRSPVPSNAVGAAADATSFVWRLDDNGDGTFTARRATVTLGQRTGESIYVLSGLSAGERIAVAGVTVLTEGRIVRLTDEAAN